MKTMPSTKPLLLALALGLPPACGHTPPPPVAPLAEAAAETAPAPGAAAPAAPGVAAAGKLHGYHVKLKCGAAQDKRSCKLDPAQEKSRLDVTLAGDPATTYEVKLRVRGLLEPRRYTGGAQVDPGNPWLYAGGAPDPLRKNNGQAYNIYQIAVSAPAAHYFLNRDTNDNLGGGYVPSHSVFKVDYPLTLKAQGGATISVITDDEAGSGMINNADQQTIEGVPPALIPQPWDGQFFYLEVESITPVS